MHQLSEVCGLYYEPHRNLHFGVYMTVLHLGWFWWSYIRENTGEVCWKLTMEEINTPKTLKKYLVCTIFLPLFSDKIKNNYGIYSKLWAVGGSGVSMMGEVDEDDLHVKKDS